MPRFRGVNHKGRRGKSIDLSHEASHRVTPRKSKCEESTEVIVSGNREGPNNPICRFECMFHVTIRRASRSRSNHGLDDKRIRVLIRKRKGEKAADHVGFGVGLNRPLPNGTMGGVRG